jgi:serine/threonine protein phosphatase PrpC
MYATRGNLLMPQAETMIGASPPHHRQDRRGLGHGTPHALTKGMQLDAFAVSVPGRRNNNEDAVCARPELGLFVVADGLGGYEGGEIASSITVETIHDLVRRTAGDGDVTWPYKLDRRHSLDENEMIIATKLANDRIVARRRGLHDQMGSTVALARFGCGTAVIAHVGDSRVYRLRDGALQQLTADHSLLNQMLAAGMAIDANFPFRHVITRALGLGLTAEPDVQRTKVYTGDVYLLCSDGLYEPFEPETIAMHLDPVVHGASVEATCKQIVDAAFEAGSRDNISAVIVRTC